MSKIAIIGNGWVGKAMQQLFSEALVYTRRQEYALSDDPKYRRLTSVKESINECDVAFVCVPTPNKIRFESLPSTKNETNMREVADGQLDTSAVEECINWLKTPLIVIRSTVNPGDCDRWTQKYGKEIVMQPEYLGETPKHPMLDPNTRQWLTMGGEKKNTRKLIELYTTVYNAHVNIRQVTLLEAEIIKLSENRAIFFKNVQIQELYDACEKARVDYYTVRDAVYGDDPRFNLWWTFIYPYKRGVISKCIPKDVYAWCAWVESTGYEPKVTRAMLERNKEWIKQSTENKS